MWEAILALIHNRQAVYYPNSGALVPNAGETARARAISVDYSHLITSPAVVNYLAAITGGQVVEAFARNGYLLYLLKQMGKQVSAYRDSWGRDGWVPIGRARRKMDVLMEYENATLLVTATEPKHAKHVATAVGVFPGPRIVYIGPAGVEFSAVGKALETSHVGGEDEYVGTHWVNDPYGIKLYSRRKPLSLWQTRTAVYPVVPERGRKRR
jgi:hypothetical protein